MRALAVFCAPFALLPLLSLADEECGMYIAISSTSTLDETKWGLYAGKDYDSGDQLGYPEVAIQMFNLQGNARLGETDDDETFLTRTLDFFEQFIWVPTPTGGQFELPEGRTVTAIPGAGILGGYNPKLTNADWNHTAALTRSAMGEVAGSSHPGRGASSTFFNVVLRATTDIKAGREIFLDYGENWEDEAEEEELTSDDYKKLDETVERMAEFFDKYNDDLDDDAKRDIYGFLTRDVMGAAVGKLKGSKITELLPSEPEKLQNIPKMGGALAYSQPRSHRDLNWLKNHGRCVDQIRPGASTIPNAGRGAFATRKIAKGGLVSPVPLVHIANEQVLDMHELGATTDEEGDEAFFRLSEEVTGQQLVLNYCYGHPESSLLFFPSGPVAALINHSEKPNAKMQWSSHPGHQRHWFHSPPETLIEEESMYIGLIMEIVAIRDIEEGEEIFIDYGPEWSEAWEEHVQTWELMKAHDEIPKEWPLKAIDLNEEYKSKPFKTVEELSNDPYPENVELKCFAPAKDGYTDEVIDNLVVREFENPPNNVHDGESIRDCVVRKRETSESGEYKYTVQRIRDDEVVMVKDVPQNLLIFVDKPGTGDQFFPDSFRHYIGIPDDIFPRGPWRDISYDESE